MIGAIADDFTGATDLASNLVRAGFRSVVVTEPAAIDRMELDAVDAVVVALKSRTAPAEVAVRESVDALGRLVARGAGTIYFKYCSTFDSTDDGNIGPVLDALMHELDARVTIAVPSFPANGRTVYQGQLFVNDTLLSDSPMKDHPLTPMREAHVPTLLARQSGSRVRSIRWQSVQQGADVVAGLLRSGSSPDENVIHVIHVIDAINDADLATIAEAASGLALVSGGSGLALGMHGPNPGASEAALVPAESGGRVILSGSASAATRAQVAHAAAVMPSRPVDLVALRENPAGELASIVDWVEGQWEAHNSRPALVYAVGEGDLIDPTSADHATTAGQLEKLFAAAARELVGRGARHVMVAGGETSGAVVSSLGVSALHFGQEISPGIAWVTGVDGESRQLNLALKSGNFGSADFFSSAWNDLS